MKRVYKTKKNTHRYAGQQPGTKSAFRPYDKPVINRGSTAHFVPPSVFPGHALHEMSLQRQIGVGTLVSSQEQIALLVALINRG